MPYIRTVDREQLMMCSLDSFVAPESIARVIDAFVEGLELLRGGRPIPGDA